MKRHLHMFEGVAARFGKATTDGRSLVLPSVMRSERKIASRELPLPLYRVTSSNIELWPSSVVPVGAVTSLCEAGRNELEVSGVLDLNELDETARDLLLSGGQLPAGVNLDRVVAEVAKGFPSWITYMTDWRVTGLMTGSLYRSPWDPPAYIKLQTGYYADWSKFPALFHSDQGDPK